MHLRVSNISGEVLADRIINETDIDNVVDKIEDVVEEVVVLDSSPASYTVLLLLFLFIMAVIICRWYFRYTRNSSKSVKKVKFKIQLSELTLHDF